MNDQASNPSEWVSAPPNPSSNVGVGTAFIAMPKDAGWSCELFGMGKSIVVRPAAGQVPNAFWRLMQRLCFGNKWIKD